MKISVSSGKTGTAIYIDTEGSFVPIRLQNMSIAAENHYRNEGLIRIRFEEKSRIDELFEA